MTDDSDDLVPSSNAASIIKETAARKGISLSALSLKAGRNHSYIQQFIKRNVPKRLPEDVRKCIAAELDIDEALLLPEPPENVPVSDYNPPPTDVLAVTHALYVMTAKLAGTEIAERIGISGFKQDAIELAETMDASDAKKANDTHVSHLSRLLEGVLSGILHNHRVPMPPNYLHRVHFASASLVAMILGMSSISLTDEAPETPKSGRQHAS